MLARIRERKIVQWLLGYLAVAWVCLEALKMVSETFGWPTVLLRIAIVLAVLGAGAVLVLGWFHGEKGRQRVTLTEVVLLAGLTALGALAVLGAGSPERPALWNPFRSVIHFDALPLEANRYAVLPFRGQDGAAEGDPGEVLLHDALARWGGIEVVDHFLIRDAWAAPDGVPSRRDELRLARSFGAGRVVRVTRTGLAREVRLNAVVHETDTGRALARATLQGIPDEVFTDSAFQGFVSRLLFQDVDLPDGLPDPEDPGTRSFAARLAYLRGHEALARWNLQGADSAFGAALDEDPGYVRAVLWRAQVRNWRGMAAGEARPHAERAAAEPEGLAPRERLLARGLLHLAREEFPEACGAYRDLLEANPRDFAAWYGLGECHERDRVVLPDPSSPSGWAFRSSYHQAVEAYRVAFTLLPSVHRGFAGGTLDRLRELLFVRADQILPGQPPPPDTLRFLAHPARLGDTLAFVPYPAADFGADGSVPSPAIHFLAVESQRRLFHEIATGWASAFPGSWEALEALAAGQYLLGDPAALETLRRARALADDPTRRRRMATEELLLLAKTGIPNGIGEVAAARALADSLLTKGPGSAGREDAGALAIPAVLLGQAHRAATFARQGARSLDFPVRIPLGIVAPAEALLVYAAMGAHADSLFALLSTVDAALRNRIPGEERSAARHHLLDLAATLAFPSAPLEGHQELARASGFPLLRAQGALAREDPDEASQILSEHREGRRGVRPAALTVDAVFGEAWLWAALGDTAQAIGTLDATLEELRWTEPGALRHPERVGALIRSLILRAELAAATGDLEGARRWARPVVILWAGADADLQPVVERMRELAGQDPLPTPYRSRISLLTSLFSRR